VGASPNGTHHDVKSAAVPGRGRLGECRNRQGAPGGPGTKTCRTGARKVVSRGNLWRRVMFRATGEMSVPGAWEAPSGQVHSSTPGTKVARLMKAGRARGGGGSDAGGGWNPGGTGLSSTPCRDEGATYAKGQVPELQRGLREPKGRSAADKRSSSPLPKLTAACGINPNHDQCHDLRHFRAGPGLSASASRQSSKIDSPAPHAPARGRCFRGAGRR